METWSTNYISNFIESYVVKFLYKIGALLIESTSDSTAIAIKLGILNFRFSLKMKAVAAVVFILTFNFCFLTILAGKLPKVLAEDDINNKQVFLGKEAPSARGTYSV